MAIFLVQELGYWVDLNASLSASVANRDGSLIPSAPVEAAVEKSHERIEFIQRWMAAMLPSLGTTMNTELINGTSMDPMERLQAISDAIAAAKVQLEKEREAKLSIAKEADERKQSAINQLRLLQEQEERVAAEAAELQQKKQMLMELVNVNSAPTPSQLPTRWSTTPARWQSTGPAPSSSNPIGTRHPAPHYEDTNPLSTPSRSSSRPSKRTEEGTAPSSTSPSPSRLTLAKSTPPPP